MNQLFNYYNQAELPALTLCNPEKVEMFNLPLAKNIKNILKYNALSELTFDYPQSADGGLTKDPAYDYIEGKMVVLVQDVGYYIISSNPEKLDGSIPIKTVSCLSLESELLSRRLTMFTGTYAFTDLLQKVLDLIPTWTIAKPAVGGSISVANGYIYHTFKTSDNFIVSNFNLKADLLIVAGGGGGGNAGGGAGGLIYEEGYALVPGTYAITIGNGGAGSLGYGSSSSNGEDTTFGALFTAVGGGGGAPETAGGSSGGSGGGAGAFGLNPAGDGTAGQGNKGGETAGSSEAGGGGGAGEAGENVTISGYSGKGGDGLKYWDGNGNIAYYSGGGGAATFYDATGGDIKEGAGGLGGGGAGGFGIDGGAGMPNSGGGGGGCGITGDGGDGGSGIVIIRYPFMGIDSDLLPLYRTFGEGSTSSNNSTAYNFLMTTAEKAYGCVFTFNTFDKTISAIKNTIPTVADTEIFLSFDNLLKTIEYKEITEELCTALHCYGGGNLDIHYVNPLGGNVIYNFSYFETRDWMSQGLIDALKVWEAMVKSKQADYADLLTQAITYDNATLQDAADLSELYDTLGADYAVRDVRVEQQLDTTEIDALIAAQDALIATKSSDLLVQRGYLLSTLIELRESVRSCDFTTKISFDNFKSDVTTAKDTLDLIFSSWRDTYNSDTFYPEFNSGALAVKSTEIITLINTAITQNQTILTTLTTGYSTYPPSSGELATLDGYIGDIITTLTSLHDDFQNIIPFTEIVFEISDVRAMYTAYQTIIYYTNNMTLAEYLELCSYIYENTYANNNIIMTDIMTPAEVQAQAQYLYDQSLGVLAKTCAPRYEFSGEYSNFIVLPEFSAFTKELDVGKVITIKKDDDSFLTPMLLEISITYDNPTEFALTPSQSSNPLSNSINLTFGNSMRLQNVNFTLGDVLGKAAQLASELDTPEPTAEVSRELTFSDHSYSLNTKTYTWIIGMPVAEGTPGPRLNTNCIVVRVDSYCVDGTSVTFNIQERATIGAVGKNTMETDLTVTPSGASETTFIHSKLSAGNWLWLEVSDVTSNGGDVTKFVVTLMVSAN